MPAKKVSIINMKGGVGKTTLSINLGLYLAELQNKKVLLIDLDPQANATIVGTDPVKLVDHKVNKKTIADLFINCIKSYGPHRKATPAKINLKDYIYKSFISPDKQSYLDIIPSEIILSSVLRGVNLGPYDLKNILVNEAEKQYDFIIIDCAPTYSVLTTLALNATEAVLIPVMSDPFGIYGVQLMQHVIKEHKFDYGIDIKVIGLIITMWDHTQRNQVNCSTEIYKHWGSEYTFPTKISKNEWYKVANGKRGAIWETAAHQHIKDEFDKFVGEFLTRV